MPTDGVSPSAREPAGAGFGRDKPGPTHRSSPGPASSADPSPKSLRTRAGPRLGRRGLRHTVGPALCRPTEYRQAPEGRLAPALAGINPAPHTDPARARHRAPIPSPTSLRPRLGRRGLQLPVGPALCRPTEYRQAPEGRLAPA